MNKQIQKLVEQAGFAMDVSNDPNSPPSWWGAGHNDRFEKFAELIVQECAKIADTAEPFLASDLIKQHFGVEE